MQKDEIVKRMAEALENLHYGSGVTSHVLAQACYQIIEEMLPKWRPISEAPRDGAEILLHGYYQEAVIGYWFQGKVFANSKERSMFWTTGAIEAGGYDAGYNELHEITHWQPLPPKPEVE